MVALDHDVTTDAGSSRVAAGLGFAVLSATSFGLSGALGRGLMDAGWSSGAAVAVRVLVAAVVLVPLAWRDLGGRWTLLRRDAGLVVGFGLAAVGLAQFAYFNAVAHMQVGVALLIEYVAPVAVVLWMWLVHGERPGRLTAVGGVVAAAGLVLVLDLVSGADVSLVGVLWALGAMVGAATYFVLSNHGGDDALPGSVLACGGLLLGGTALLVGGVAHAIPMAASTQPVPFTTVAGRVEVPWWLPVALLGLVTAAVAYVAGIAANRRLGSRLASFVALGEVLAALVFAWLLLGELPRLLQVAGGVLVLAGVVLVKLGERNVGGGSVVLVEPRDDVA